jgi:hypothetical protein
MIDTSLLTTQHTTSAETRFLHTYLKKSQLFIVVILDVMVKIKYFTIYNTRKKN